MGRQNNSSVDRKASVAPLIGTVSPVNWAAWYNYSDNAITYSAEDGTQQFTPVTCGVFSPNPASGFEFTVTAGLSERTLNVYLGAYRGQGRFEAYLSDGSAAPYIDTSTDSGTQNGINQVYSIRYHAASERQTLTVRYTLLTNRNYGNVTLQAITLSGPSLPPVPPLYIATDSLNGSTTNAPYSATLLAGDGLPPYTWSVISGTLPAGLTLSPSGTISGTTYSTTGVSNFTVQVQDALTTLSKALSIPVFRVDSVTPSSGGRGRQLR